ncbi:hypothetical protein KY331_05860 [Candidatus Woesearchaeota archaeon]|nr:hypothetical protein [Candidatus Woesearchaeota archaeon]
MFSETHRFIIKHALQFRRKHFNKYEKLIEDACIKEDYPNISLDPKDISLFGTDHFYNPHSKTGNSRFFLDAKTKGIYLFEKAFDLYKDKKIKEAFYTLGRSTHYLMDIASPSHTKLLFHLTEDDFEKYVDQNIHKFEFQIRSKIIPPLKPEDCFEKLARKSHSVEYKKQNYIVGLFWDLFIYRKQADPERKLNRISKKLIKESIIFTIALLNAFNRKIMRYNRIQRGKRFVGKLKKKLNK